MPTHKLKERKMDKLALLPSHTLIPMFIRPIEPTTKPVISLNDWAPPRVRLLGVHIEYRRKDNGDIVILPEGFKMQNVELEPLYEFGPTSIKPCTD